MMSADLTRCGTTNSSWPTPSLPITLVGAEA